LEESISNQLRTSNQGNFNQIGPTSNKAAVSTVH